MGFIRSTIILVCAALFAAASAHAEVLKIVTIDLPPYGYIENNQPTGLNYELGNSIAKEAGYIPDNTILPFARAMNDIATGVADISIMFPNPTIDEHAENLGEILPMETVIIGRAGNYFRSLKELRGKIIATVRGAKYDERISKSNGYILYPTDNYSQSLKMLLAGRVDAVIGPKLGLYFTTKKNHIPKQALGEPLVLSVRQGCLFLTNQKTTGTMRQRIIKAVQRLTENGTIQAILTKYSL